LSKDTFREFLSYKIIKHNVSSFGTLNNGIDERIMGTRIKIQA